MSDFNLSPHELLQEVYPVASSCIGPLREIIRINPELAEQVLELAVTIGINCAMRRLQWDKTEELLAKFQPFSWSATTERFGGLPNRVTSNE